MPKRGLKEAPSVARSAGRRGRQNGMAVDPGLPPREAPQPVLGSADVRRLVHVRPDPAVLWVLVARPGDLRVEVLLPVPLDQEVLPRR
jgi:hypothetical protein